MKIQIVLYVVFFVEILFPQVEMNYSYEMKEAEQYIKKPFRK